MATPALNSRVQSLVTEYGVFWQFWPQFEQTHGERRLVGFEVELIGSHTSDLNHVDPACPTCRHVRSVLLAIADLMPGELTSQPKFPHVQYRLSLKLDCLFACFRQSLGSVGKYLRFLEPAKRPVV